MAGTTTALKTKSLSVKSRRSITIWLVYISTALIGCLFLLTFFFERKVQNADPTTTLIPFLIELLLALFCFIIYKSARKSMRLPPIFTEVLASSLTATSALFLLALIRFRVFQVQDFVFVNFFLFSFALTFILIIAWLPYMRLLKRKEEYNSITAKIGFLQTELKGASTLTGSLDLEDKQMKEIAKKHKRIKRGLKSLSDLVNSHERRIRTDSYTNNLAAGFAMTIVGVLMGVLIPGVLRRIF